MPSNENLPNPFNDLGTHTPSASSHPDVAEAIRRQIAVALIVSPRLGTCRVFHYANELVASALRPMPIPSQTVAELGTAVEQPHGIDVRGGVPHF